MSKWDPFKPMRKATLDRHNAQDRWIEEMRALRAAGYSTRFIAGLAGVSHDTVWKMTR